MAENKPVRSRTSLIVKIPIGSIQLELEKFFSGLLFGGIAWQGIDPFAHYGPNIWNWQSGGKIGTRFGGMWRSAVGAMAIDSVEEVVGLCHRVDR